MPDPVPILGSEGSAVFYCRLKQEKNCPLGQNKEKLHAKANDLHAHTNEMRFDQPSVGIQVQVVGHLYT